MTSDLPEALERAKLIARLGIIPTTTVRHTASGHVEDAEVRIYTNTDQTQLLKALGSKLDPERRQKLTDLVLARGPISHATLTRIINAHKIGMKPAKIAEKLNELGIIDGMGGKRWTTQKVLKLLAEHERQSGQSSEAA